MRRSVHLNEGEIIIAATETENNNNGSEVLTVESIDTHIYFYSPVNSDRCLALIKELRSLDEKLRNERISRDIPEEYPHTPIWLHINSSGGDGMAAFGVVDQMRQIQTPIYSIAEGCCASAGTFISCAATRRYIQPSAFMLIHQLWAWTWGTYTQIKDEVHLYDMLMSQAAEFYVDHSDMDEEKVRRLLERDSWFNAQECLELGLVDEIK